MEWADSLGVDVTSTSLGYLNDFDFGFTNYTWQNMDGKTARITIGSEMAVRKGIVVVNSAGNEASTGTPNTLVAPADGDSVIAVGSVTIYSKPGPNGTTIPAGTVSSFSSYGPTFDGRTKPDVMAGGEGNLIASASSINGYINNNANYTGTSFSAPLVAGVAALILQKDTTLTPIQVREALRNTASNTTPDNNYGWGVIDALAAVNYWNPTDIVTPKEEKKLPENYELAQNYPNPFNPSTRIKYQIKDGGYVTLKIYNLLGNLVATLVSESEPAGTYDVEFNAKDSENPLPSGVYFYRLQVGNFVATKKMVIMK